VSTIGELDSPMLPDAQGMTAMLQHLRGEDAIGRQQRRDQVLGTSPEGFMRIAAALKEVAETGAVKVVGSAEAVEAHGGFESTERLL
jgi:Zn-dependent M16 (insulinase) family peptidase